jgi:hypothetical protein
MSSEHVSGRAVARARARVSSVGRRRTVERYVSAARARRANCAAARRPLRAARRIYAPGQDLVLHARDPRRTRRRDRHATCSPVGRQSGGTAVRLVHAAGGGRSCSALAGSLGRERSQARVLEAGGTNRVARQQILRDGISRSRIGFSTRDGTRDIRNDTTSGAPGVRLTVASSSIRGFARDGEARSRTDARAKGRSWFAVGRVRWCHYARRNGSSRNIWHATHFAELAAADQTIPRSRSLREGASTLREPPADRKLTESSVLGHARDRASTR